MLYGYYTQHGKGHELYSLRGYNPNRSVIINYKKRRYKILYMFESTKQKIIRFLRVNRHKPRFTEFLDILNTDLSNKDPSFQPGKYELPKHLPMYSFEGLLLIANEYNFGIKKL